MSRVGKVGSSLHCLQIKSLDGLINPQTVRHNVETKLLASFPLSSAKPANISYHIYFQASCKLSAKPANICSRSFGHNDTISLSIFENFNKEIWILNNHVKDECSTWCYKWMGWDFGLFSAKQACLPVTLTLFHSVHFKHSC